MGSVEYSASEARAPRSHNSLRFSKSSVVSVGMSWSAFRSGITLPFFSPNRNYLCMELHMLKAPLSRLKSVIRK